MLIPEDKIWIVDEDHLILYLDSYHPLNSLLLFIYFVIRKQDPFRRILGVNQNLIFHLCLGR